MTKKERHSAILKLIDENEIGTQEELTTKLIEMGLDVSQATVSRDINELDLIKVEGKIKKYKYLKPVNAMAAVPDSLITLFNHVTLNIESANNLIVVKTLSGNAGSAGMAIDAMHIPEIIGTVAGDDTLLIVAKNEANADKILKILRNV